MIQKYAILISIFLMRFIFFAQDSTYIDEYSDGLMVRLQVATEQIQMEFKSPIDSLSPVLYQPNNLSKSGFKLSYNGIGLAIMTKSSNYGKDPELYGSTHQFVLNLGVRRRKWGVDFDYKRVWGFYVNDPGKYFFPPKKGLGPLKREDIRTRNLMISVTQVFKSDKFSYQMQTNQTEIQKKSAGSPLLKYNFASNAINGDTSFIPRSYVPFFKGLERFRSGRFNALIVQPGYTHTFVLKEQLSFNFRALLGWGIQHRHLTTDNNSTLRSVNITSKFDLGLSVMYFRPKFSLGLSGDIAIISTGFKKSQYNVQNNQILIFIGHRFTKVKLFPKFFEKLEAKKNKK